MLIEHDVKFTRREQNSISWLEIQILIFFSTVRNVQYSWHPHFFEVSTFGFWLPPSTLVNLSRLPAPFPRPNQIFFIISETRCTNPASALYSAGQNQAGYQNVKSRLIFTSERIIR